MQHKATIFYEWEQGKSAYHFPFPYLSKQFVKVRVDHANTSTLLEYNRDYTIEGQTLTLTPVQPFVSGATLCIYRQTPTGSLVDFSDGSLLLASEMDRLSAQLLHVEEENSDLIASTGMFADEDNAWQGQGKRIKNLSNPQNPQDAVTLNYLDGVDVARQSELQRIETAVRADKESTLSFKNEAASSASASAQSAATSEASRQASAVSESNIKNMQVDVHAMQSHVDEVKTAIDDVAAQAKADRLTASDAALQAQNSAETSVQSAAASEEAAKRAEAAARFDGVVQSENLAEKSVHKKHLHQDAYESPALTGIPTAPTANKGTNTQQIANTAFVANGLADKFDKTGGVINPAFISDEGYTEGIRIATAPNNWSTFILGCKPNTYEGNQAKNGGWGFFRTPANELIIGNRDCMADSSAVVFGADQKAYFKQMVYAPDFFAHTRCYAQDAFVTTGDGGLYLQKWGGGWYMNEGIWMRAYGDKNIYTGGVMKADGGFEGNLRGRSDATNGIAILTGVINDGGTIPLPDGYTESQCRWMVSPKSDNYNLSTWDMNESGGQQLIYTFYCHTEGRKVVCRSRHVGDDGDRTFLGSVNYMIIGVK